MFKFFSSFLILACIIRQLCWLLCLQELYLLEEKTSQGQTVKHFCFLCCIVSVEGYKFYKSSYDNHYFIGLGFLSCKRLNLKNLITLEIRCPYPNDDHKSCAYIGEGEVIVFKSIVSLYDLKVSV
jgi:hypothetical protein